MSRKSSQNRIEANRRNAQKSTGPRTDEGKARSAQNSTTHGFSALNSNPLDRGCFLHVEDEPQFLGLLNEYVKTYHPQHPDELDLLTEAVYAKWRQHRIWLAETAHIEIAIANHETELRRSLPAANNNAQLANGFAHSEQMLKLYIRYDAQLHRHYRNCLKDLRDLQAERALAPEPEPEPPNEPKPPAPETRNETEISPEPAEKAATPSEPKLTPEEARALAEKAKIQRIMDINLGRIPFPSNDPFSIR